MQLHCGTDKHRALQRCTPAHQRERDLPLLPVLAPCRDLAVRLRPTRDPGALSLRHVARRAWLSHSVRGAGLWLANISEQLTS